MSQVQRFYGTKTVTYIFSVEAHHDGLRLDQLVKSYLGQRSRETIKKKILKGEITISNRVTPHRPSTKVHHGEEVTMLIHKPSGERELYYEHFNFELVEIEQNPTLVFEDEETLIINKPPFMATHPTGRHFFNCATSYYQNIYDRTIHSVHRLDRETSGILVLTKNPKQATKLSDYFLKRKVKKCYFLISHRKNKEVIFPLVAKERLAVPKGDDARLFMETKSETSTEGKSALTEFELLFQNDDYILALAFPYTGRQHQIRAHAAHHGFPLLGDKIYHGGVSLFKRYKDNLTTAEDYDLMQIPRQALHAMSLTLPYPDEKNLTPYFAPLPKDLTDWIQDHLKIDLKELHQKIEKIAKVNFVKNQMVLSDEFESSDEETESEED